MARQIAEQNEAVLTEVESKTGTTFIKNHLNEIVVLPDGTHYKFQHPRVTITDPALAKGLKAVAAKHGILIE